MQEPANAQPRHFEYRAEGAPMLDRPTRVLPTFQSETLQNCVRKILAEVTDASSVHNRRNEWPVGRVSLDNWADLPAVPAERIQVRHSQRCQEPSLEPNACRPSRVHGLRVGCARGPPSSGRERALERARLSEDPSRIRGEPLEKLFFGEGLPLGGTAGPRKRNQRLVGACRRATRWSSLRQA